MQPFLMWHLRYIIYCQNAATAKAKEVKIGKMGTWLRGKKKLQTSLQR